MVKYLGIILVVFLMGKFEGCNKEDKCEETKAPEINFKFLLGGDIFIVEKGHTRDITVDFDNVNMMMYKVYCSGHSNGPFEQNYLIQTDGILVKQGIGSWSFKMDNKDDYMRVVLFCDTKELGTQYIYYADLEKHDQGSAYFEFSIRTVWDPEKKDFIEYDTFITRN
jgi:hypothetical protein